MKLKYIFFIILFCLSGNNLFAYEFTNSVNTSQSTVNIHYFVVDLNSTTYKTSSIKLNTANIIGQGTEIDIFNVFLNPQIFVTFSVLPTKKMKDNWTNINVDSVKNDIIDIDFLLVTFKKGVKEINSSSIANYDKLKRDDIKIIIKKGNKYVMSKYCITEFFKIITKEVVFPNLMSPIEINIKSPTYKVNSFEEQYKRINNTYSVNSIISTQSVGASFFTNQFEKPLLFFSGQSNIGNLKGYKFWQFTTWPVTIGHGLNAQRGVDRFIYVPDIGIVAGSYDFWFKQYLSDERLQNNYLNEVVILPESINDKRPDEF